MTTLYAFDDDVAYLFTGATAAELVGSSVSDLQPAELAGLGLRRLTFDANVTTVSLGALVARLKARRVAEAQRLRDDIELRAAFAWTCPADGKTYSLDGNERSIARMLKVRDLLAEMENKGTPVSGARQPWRTADDRYTPPLGPNDITNMLYAKGVQGMAAWDAFRTHEAAIMALRTAQEVTQYDLATGWPVAPEG